MKYTESQIKAIGGKRFIKKRYKRIFLLYVLCLGWIPLVYWLVNEPQWLILYAPITLITLNVIWGYIQSRNIFYEKIKKNPELLQ
jgi:peptidoglycan/LPS O-acetylase OafA/YrhL